MDLGSTRFLFLDVLTVFFVISFYTFRFFQYTPFILLDSTVLLQLTLYFIVRNETSRKHFQILLSVVHVDHGDKIVVVVLDISGVPV